MNEHDGLAAWLRLTLIPGIGGETQRKLLAAFGSPAAVFAAGPVATRTIAASRADLLFDTDNRAAIDNALAWAEQPGNHILPLDHPDYPPDLLQIADPPNLLYVKGDPSLLRRRALAVVGSRNATPQGMQTAEAFAKALAVQGLCIVSGLALGIDAAAHRGALAANGATVAIIGTGADRIYRPATASWRWPSPSAAPSFPNFRSAHRCWRLTFRGATASFPGWHRVYWWLKQRRKAAR